MKKLWNFNMAFPVNVQLVEKLNPSITVLLSFFINNEIKIKDVHVTTIAHTFGFSEKTMWNYLHKIHDLGLFKDSVKSLDKKFEGIRFLIDEEKLNSLINDN
jgi:hypothetical protein